MTTLFISDLHLDPSRPVIVKEFIALIEKPGAFSALYILGDFVEYWIGDDDKAHGLDAAFDALKRVTQRGIPVYLMHGNRDFLIGKTFAERYGVTLLNDPAIIDLYGQTALLMHGDTLCTDDVDYQNFRNMVRDPAWQAGFLNKPLDERRAIVKNLRETSKQATGNKTDAIMDVNQHAVEQAMRLHDVSLLIHGHTHRPAIHEFTLDGHPAKRIVLGDWYDQSSTLEISESGVALKP